MRDPCAVILMVIVGLMFMINGVLLSVENIIPSIVGGFIVAVGFCSIVWVVYCDDDIAQHAEAKPNRKKYRIISQHDTTNNPRKKIKIADPISKFVASNSLVIDVNPYDFNYGDNSINSPYDFVDRDEI